MIFTQQLAFSTPDGRHFPLALFDLWLDRHGGSVRVFSDATRSVALAPLAPWRRGAHPSQYRDDPTPLADELVQNCLDVLRSGAFRSRPVEDDVRWLTFAFDAPTPGRWAGWTNKVKRRTLARLVAMNSDY
jgi:hypothetical protein